MTRRRVAIVMPMHWSFSLGGAEMQVQMLVRRLVAQGEFDVHFVAREIDPGYRPEGYALHKVASRRSLAGTYPLDVGPLMDLLGRIQPDAIYQRVGGAYTFAAARYAQQARRRMIWHVSSNNDLAVTAWRPSLRSPLEQLDRRLIDYGARHATSVIVQNAEQAGLLHRLFGRADAIRIPNFHPVPSRLPRKPNDRITVCWLANLKPLKQPQLFLDLAADFERRSDLRFVVAGAQQMHGPAWEALLARMRRAPNLEYVGHLRPDDANELLTRSHILVNTSEYEGFPNTFIQAWFREVPVISLNVNPDQLLDGERLGYCAGGDYQRMKQAIDRFAADPSLVARMGQEAAALAKERFSEGNMDSIAQLLRNQ